ncbi:hypothetical protein QJS10_CPB11g00801 [Acorus calamus]|uniref:Uncharacterized protein n=1 Tax=Acorus calamus TaxID=4465 RepID=A0AAV9DTF8_ACOCL|nr:hypothetical protein QJS10_CPB11g00801 [Acorus calamus]
MAYYYKMYIAKERVHDSIHCGENFVRDCLEGHRRNSFDLLRMEPEVLPLDPLSGIPTVTKQTFIERQGSYANSGPPMITEVIPTIMILEDPNPRSSRIGNPLPKLLGE